jgi:cell division protein FtsL
MDKLLKVCLFLLLAVVIVISFALIFPAYNNLNKMTVRVSELEKELEKRKNECSQLRKQLYDLQNNPKAVEKVAREKYNMCGENETVYIYENPATGKKEDVKSPEKK